MKKFFLTLAVMVMAICASAQKNQYFWYQGHLMMGNPIAQIDSVTFGEEDTDSILVYLPRTIIKTVEVHDTVYITIHDTICPDAISEGALNGEFSVSATKKVRFSQGNLQFNAALGTHQCADGTTKQGTWRFAENQYDTIGRANTLISSSYEGWIDLFAYGTSGWNSGANMYEPWSRSYYHDNFNVGGSSSNDLTGVYAYADWGVYNAISNGGDQPSLWRCLSKEEAEYLFYSRPNANNLFGYATVNNVKGLIILPDNWQASNNISFTPFTKDFAANIFSLSEWELISSQVVFLPCASVLVLTNNFGGDSPDEVADEGFYRLSTAGDRTSSTYHINIRVENNDINLELVDSYYWRSDGMSVRLVQDVK